MNIEDVKIGMNVLCIDRNGYAYIQKGTIYEVCELDDYNHIGLKGIYGGVCVYHTGIFEPVPEPVVHKFHVGQPIRCLGSSSSDIAHLTKDAIYTIKRITGYFVYLEEEPNIWAAYHFEPAPKFTDFETYTKQMCEAGNIFSFEDIEKCMEDIKKEPLDKYGKWALEHYDSIMEENKMEIQQINERIIVEEITGEPVTAVGAYEGRVPAYITKENKYILLRETFDVGITPDDVKKIMKDKSKSLSKFYYEGFVQTLSGYSVEKVK